MVGVCASMMGVEKDKVVSVSTDFGPEGPAEDAARRRLETTSRWVACLPPLPVLPYTLVALKIFACFFYVAGGGRESWFPLLPARRVVQSGLFDCRSVFQWRECSQDRAPGKGGGAFAC